MPPGTLEASRMKLRGIAFPLVVALALVGCGQKENADSGVVPVVPPDSVAPDQGSDAADPVASSNGAEKEAAADPDPAPDPTPAENPAASASEEKPSGPRITFETSEGSFVLELDPVNAPISTKNFLGYVNDGFYDGTIFHRVIDDFMIQGGGFELIDGKGSQKVTKAPIVNEAMNGLKNDRGTISMARTSDPDSATSQFFINVVDNPGLDPKTEANPTGFSPDGYAVFGRVVEGMEVIDTIRKTETGIKRMMARAPGGDLRESPMTDVPLRNAVIKKASVSSSP